MKKYLFLIISFLTALVASGATYYVVPGGAGSKNGTSWANAYADVQTAIDSASSAGGGEVWIAKGTYKHGSAMTMKNNVAIYGGFAGTETSKEERTSGNFVYLDGENKYTVIHNNYSSSSRLNNSAILDSVTISNGYSTKDPGGLRNNYASPIIRNCTFINNNGYNGGAIENMYSDPIIQNCTIANNKGSYGAGIKNDYSSPIVINSTIYNNTGANEGGSFRNLAGSCPKIINCILWNNSASRGDEIYNDGSNSKPIIDTCIIENGKSGIYNSSYCTFTTEPITGNPLLQSLVDNGGFVQTIAVTEGSPAIDAGKVVEGITTDARGVKRSATPTIGAYEYESVAAASPSIIKQPSGVEVYEGLSMSLTVSATGGALSYQWYFNDEAIEGATSATYNLNNVTSPMSGSYYCEVSNSLGKVLTEKVNVITKSVPCFYVVDGGAGNKDGSSWKNAYSDVQDAIDAATNVGAGEVWIAKGTYKHGSAMTMKNNVAIYGGFAGTETSKDQRVAGQNRTILDGEGKYRVFDNNYTEEYPLTNSAKLDNVTIQNGYVNGEAPNERGGAMFNDNAFPVITNCIFENNYATGYGGAIFTSRGDPMFVNCSFLNNSVGYSGGAIYNGKSNSIYTNCSFINNKAIGSTGYGGGVGNWDSSSPVFKNCTFANNDATYSGGGMYNQSSTPLVVNCTFSENNANSSTYCYGGGIANSSGANSLIINCTFYGNSSDSGGGIFNHLSNPIITNCILWENKATYENSEIHNYNTLCVPTIDTCVMMGGYTGKSGSSNNIITANPKLLTLSDNGGNVQTIALARGSSAIGAGIVTEDTPTTDARGFTRSTTAPTIGAYEVVSIEIKNDISDKSVFETKSESFEIETELTDVLYQWQFSSNNEDWQNIENATSSILALENITKSQAGYYRCVLSKNAWLDTISNVAQLIVHSTANIEIQPTNIEAYSNKNSNLSISATGEELTYQWYKVDENGDVKLEGETDSTLNFENIQVGKSGSYYCIITNPAGSVQSSTATVTVRQSATEDSITKGLEKITTVSGAGYARFVVETTAYNPTYKWYYGSGDTWSEFEETSNILFIPAESKYNRKNIKCEISNGGESVFTQAVLVYNSTAIQITSQPQDVSFKLNENASFDVTVSTSTGNAYYQWQYSADGNEWQNIENATNATYSFKMTDSKNRGYYRCEVDNGGGVLYSENAKIIFPEDVAITKQPTAITSAIIGTKATFTVVASGYEPKYQWQVSYDYGENWENIEGATNATLGVDVVENIIENSYRCLIWNDNNVDAPLESEMIWIENAQQPTAFQKWSIENGLGVDALPTATPHNDGITNLEKFAFGLDASRATSYDVNANIKYSTDASGNASLQFSVNVDAEGVVQVKALKSTDLINWTEATATATGETSSDGKFKIYKATAPVGEDGKVFLKLKVEEK